MSIFQRKLLTLFPTWSHISIHKEVVRFACGLSKHVASFLSKNYFPVARANVIKEFFDLLRENEIFSQDIFQDVPQVEELFLFGVNLNKSEVQSLYKAVEAGKLPGLTKLYLEIAGCSEAELQSLSALITKGKLRKLRILGLYTTDLSHVKSEVEALIAACDAHCVKDMELGLFANGLSEETVQEWRKKYHHVKDLFCCFLFLSVNMSVLSLTEL